MTNNHIFIPIELPVRESSSSAMMASFLASKGLSVVVGAQSDIRSLALRSKNCIYLDKTLYAAHNDFYKKLDKNSISIFCDDIEASGCHVPEVYAQARFSQENIDLVEGIFFWGNDDFTAVNDNYDLAVNKCHQQGSFRSYFWKYFSAQMPLNIKNKIRLINRYKKFVFIPSNFGGSMRSDGISSIIKQAREDYPKLATKIIERIEHTEKRRGDFVDAIIRLVDNHTDINFIFRPHPNEDVRKWRGVFPTRANFFIEYEGTVTEYILGCNAMIHSGCTSAFEAYFYDKPCLAYVPNRNVKWDAWQANAMSVEVESYETLTSALKTALSSVERIPTEDPFYPIGKDLLQYYCDVFSEAIKTKQSNSKSISRIARILRVKKGFKEFFNIRKNLSERKFDDKDFSNLNERLKFFNESFSSQHISIEKLTDKVVVLRKEKKTTQH